MEQKFKRIEDLDQKIKNISLPYLEWKVLFLIGDDVSAMEVVDIVKEESDVVQRAIESLEQKELIEKSSSEAPEVVEEKPVTEAIEEIDLKEEEVVEAPIEDETKIEVSEVEDEEPEESEDQPPDELLDFDDKPEMDDEPPQDTETSMPDLVEEEGDTELAALEQETAEEDAPAAMVSEGELVPGMDTLTAEPETETEKPAEDSGFDSSKKSIMVIDDSIVIRKMIEIALEDEEFNILNATSGKEGMDAIDKHAPDLVILDMMLPDMSGIDVLKKIKDSKDIPVIMLSGKDSPQLVENAKELGVNDFLPKPFKDEELVEKVKSLVE